jgi:hypothetical protein
MYKTTSGKEVKLQPVTLSQRIECEDASSIGYSSDGGVVVHNVAKAGLKWCCAGTGKTVAELEKDRFTYKDIMEIGAEVKRLASLDPTQESDSS